jgi:hypothetical protein
MIWQPERVFGVAHAGWRPRSQQGLPNSARPDCSSSRSVAHDYPAVRATGETSWAVRGIPGSDRLLEYEARLNDALETVPVTAVCQYDVNLFDGATILDILKVHPIMISRGQLVRNPFYIRPDEFLSAHRPRPV